ncbi:MAG TPA: hypothetical protein VIN61_16610 [Gammaproteobacteria bacterium]
MPKFCSPGRVAALALTGAAAWLSACSSSVVVQSTFPTPLVEPLPLRMGVIMDDDLVNYIHAEDVPQQSTWTIDLGDANVALLEPLFESMFLETRVVEGLPASGMGLDGVLHPALEKFEFDVPIGERDEFVEVWMQYKLTLYEPDGTMVAEWPVSGYGKAELRGKREEAVHRAAVVAMREVGASISTKFAAQPQVSYWLEEKTNGATLSAGQASN